ncbi:hypothetical protein GPECTOR_37g138 [Gonium pectorale]|uniref:Uncharacterized protein n=1 Tax=Gonium pectorale TaxID=33097 RepID=A0A150GBJ0_GONPE|nr:hypothetical protein GPECTOR_37g138 [Gonium pectorale]|eukprot:KXZ47133.1 hypothetical protein GPECTOR_37g138 [Gonium pectorale]
MAVADIVLDIMTSRKKSDDNVLSEELALAWMFLGRTVMSKAHTGHPWQAKVEVKQDADDVLIVDIESSIRHLFESLRIKDHIQKVLRQGRDAEEDRLEDIDDQFNALFDPFKERARKCGVIQFDQVKIPSDGEEMAAPADDVRCGRNSWRAAQLMWLIQRSILNSIRNAWLTLADSLMLYLAALVIGLVQGYQWDLADVPGNIVMAYMVLAVLAAIVHLRTFSTTRFVLARLMVTIFVVLIVGAFMHGLSPTIRSIRGGFFEGIWGFSYNRWAMEAGVIKEYASYGDTRLVEIISTYYKYGICNLDTELMDDGNDDISTTEMVSFYNLQRSHSERSCDKYYIRACWEATSFLGLMMGSRKPRMWLSGLLNLDQKIEKLVLLGFKKYGSSDRAKSKAKRLYRACESGRADAAMVLLQEGACIDVLPDEVT